MENIKFKDLYQKMFLALRDGQQDLADNLRIIVEKLRKQRYSQPPIEDIEKIKLILPKFALSVLNRTQKEIGITERSNCMNAALNFHAQVPRWKTYTVLEFFERLKADFVQVPFDAQPYLGDLIVMWSRNEGGKWDNKPIDTREMDHTEPDFPYGLVFDHVVVRLNEDLVFHKPDPTHASAYQIDFLKAAAAPTVHNNGFEMTFHRKK